MKALSEMREKAEDIKKLLKLFFQAGVTPEFAQNPKDADALKGRLELLSVLFLNLSMKIFMILW